MSLNERHQRTAFLWNLMRISVAGNGWIFFYNVTTFGEESSSEIDYLKVDIDEQLFLFFLNILSTNTWVSGMPAHTSSVRGWKYMWHHIPPYTKLLPPCLGRNLRKDLPFFSFLASDVGYTQKNMSAVGSCARVVKNNAYQSRNPILQSWLWCPWARHQYLEN